MKFNLLHELLLERCCNKERKHGGAGKFIDSAIAQDSKNK